MKINDIWLLTENKNSTFTDQITRHFENSIIWLVAKHHGMSQEDILTLGYTGDYEDDQKYLDNPGKLKLLDRGLDIPGIDDTLSLVIMNGGQKAEVSYSHNPQYRHLIVVNGHAIVERTSDRDPEEHIRQAMTFLNGKLVDIFESLTPSKEPMINTDEVVDKVLMIIKNRYMSMPMHDKRLLGHDNLERAVRRSLGDQTATYVPTGRENIDQKAEKVYHVLSQLVDPELDVVKTRYPDAWKKLVKRSLKMVMGINDASE